MKSVFKIELEEFKFLPANRAYLVSDKGRIFSKNKKRFVSGSVDITGYSRIGIWAFGKQTSYLVHRLVMETFCGCCPHGYQVNHRDGNKLNNKLSNLEYCTPSENIRHSYQMGLQRVSTGENHGQCKLSDLQIQQIREDLKTPGVRQIALAKKYNVSYSLISRIKRKPDYRKTI